MPGLMDVIGSALGGEVQTQLGQRIGADSQTTSQAIAAALPMLLSGLHRNASQPNGAASLLGALQRDHDGSLLDNLGGLLGGGNAGQAANGAGIVDHVLGDQQESAHQMVATASGLNTGQAAQLMATLAPIVMSALGRVQRSEGLDASGLTSLLQGEHATAAQSQPDLMGLASKLFGQTEGTDVMKGLGSLLGGR